MCFAVSKAHHFVKFANSERKQILLVFSVSRLTRRKHVLAHGDNVVIKDTV